jgi:hypothetical protein
VISRVDPELSDLIAVNAATANPTMNVIDLLVNAHVLENSSALAVPVVVKMANGEISAIKAATVREQNLAIR